MFDNVLAGVDGSANGRDAIVLAHRLMAADGKLTLVHVRRGEFGLLKAVQRELLKEDREASSNLLEQEREATGVAAELRSVVASSVGAGLHGQAELQGADLLVVGSCRHGAAGRAMLGNDARDALNGAPCAVAIAAHGYADRQTGVARIGVAYDGSPESEVALQAARALAAATGASIELREVVFTPAIAYTGFGAVDIGTSIDQVVKDAERRVEAIPGVTAKVLYGPPDAELEVFSDEVDVLVLGSRSYGPVKRLMLGSTSNHLARHAACSLIVLPRGASRDSERTSAKSGREPIVSAAG